MSKKTLELVAALKQGWLENVDPDVVDVDILQDELTRLHKIEEAFNVWMDKTEWVLINAQPGELGRHRADVMLMRIASSYEEGRRHGIYEARNARNERFGL